MDMILPEDGPQVDLSEQPPPDTGPDFLDLASGPVDWGVERGFAIEPCHGCITRRWDARHAAVSVDPDALRALDRGAGQ